MKYKKNSITRRELIKQFGFAAFVLHPILRSMAWAASEPFSTAPRFIMFFKGGAYTPTSMFAAAAGQSAKTGESGTSGDPDIRSFADLANTTMMNKTPLGPLAAHAQDLILFRNMNIHGGSPKSDGYTEEHGAGLIGCNTGGTVRYQGTGNDSYYAYTNEESIDVRIARHYKALPSLKDVAFSSLHIGGGAHSDADSVGVGQRYISYQARAQVTGTSYWANAIEPVQDAAQVYTSLINRIDLITGLNCSGSASSAKAALLRQKSVLDFKLKDINDMASKFGLDSEHAHKLQGLMDGWKQTEDVVLQKIAAADGVSPSGKTCPTMTKPTGNGSKLSNLDQLSSVHDQMISLIQLAFQWDLTRVVAFTLSGASSGQSWPGGGVNSAHHSLEHSNDKAGLTKLDTYYSMKFSNLLTALKAVDDGGGKTALNNSSVILGMECWSTSSNNHYLKNVPFLFAGQGGGRFKTGSVVDAGGRNNNDLLVACQNASGITDSTFGLASLCSSAKGSIIPLV